VVITGAGGFLGTLLAEELLLRRGTVRGEPVTEVVGVDLVPPARPLPGLRVVVGDLAEPGLLATVIDAETVAVFHLAAVVSGEAETDPDLSARVNLDGARHVLDACRHTGCTPTVVFTSSLAVYGGELPAVVGDETVLRPASTYGAHKAAAELLLADYTRKGYLDGRALRLPTICVRPGSPNRAASSFLSSIVREPLAGAPAVCPVAPETLVWLMSPGRAVTCLADAAELPSAALGPVRALNLPGVTVAVSEMVAALGRVAGPQATELVSWARDPQIEQIVCSWPSAVDGSRAESLGFHGDACFDEILAAYLASMPTV
jgi:nucleoside-diphosphate-sugar epimerase